MRWCSSSISTWSRAHRHNGIAEVDVAHLAISGPRELQSSSGSNPSLSKLTVARRTPVTEHGDESDWRLPYQNRFLKLK